MSGREKGRHANAHSKYAMILNRVCEQFLATPQRSLIPAGPAAPSRITYRHSRDCVLLLPNIACLTVELMAIAHEIGASLHDCVCPEHSDRSPNVLNPTYCEDISNKIHHPTDSQGELTL